MLFLFLGLLLSVLCVNGEHFAVLVAGSREYYNYRHQADTAHAFQVLKKHGVPRENIIVMMFNDVPFDPANPFPGRLFNKPGTQPDDVYAGLTPDYQGTDVTAENFLSVLTGNISAPGPVLNTGPNDEIFVFFSDHGGTGLVAFPSGPFLTSKDLNQALRKMHDKKMYRKLVFYLEACESGSMFNNQLPNNTQVYATTASSPDESSWGTYCSPYDVINGTNLNTCLGDLYSVSWLEDADNSNLSLETLLDQFLLVQKETNLSHVLQYGDLDFDQDPVDEFEGNNDFDSRPISHTKRHKPGPLIRKPLPATPSTLQEPHKPSKSKRRLSVSILIEESEPASDDANKAEPRQLHPIPNKHKKGKHHSLNKHKKKKPSPRLRLHKIRKAVHQRVLPKMRPLGYDNMQRATDEARARSIISKLPLNSPVDAMSKAATEARLRTLVPSSSVSTSVDDDFHKQARAHVVDNRDSKYHYLSTLYLRAPPERKLQASQRLKQELEERHATDHLFRKLARQLLRKPFDPKGPLFAQQVEVFVTGILTRPEECDECCDRAFELIRTKCFAGLGGDRSGAWTDYALKYTRFVPNICEYSRIQRYPFSDIEKAIGSVCSIPLTPSR